MSRNTGAVARRTSLLATSVFASTMIVSIGGFAINVATPVSQAMAANCANASVGNQTSTFTCTANNTTETLQAGTSITSLPGTDGFVVQGNGTAGNGESFVGNGPINVSGNAVNITTSGNGSPINIDISSSMTGGNATAGTGSGIIAGAGGVSDVTVTLENRSESIQGDGTSGSVNAGHNTYGVHATSLGGNVTINAGNVTSGGNVSVAAGNGLVASTSGAGNVAVLSAASITATDGAAISVNNTGGGNGSVGVGYNPGNGTITRLTGSQSSIGTDGNSNAAINATNSGTGGVSVYTGVDTVSSAHNDGIMRSRLTMVW